MKDSIFNRLFNRNENSDARTLAALRESLTKLASSDTIHYDITSKLYEKP